MLEPGHDVEPTTMTGTVAGVDAAPTTSLRPSLTTPAVIIVVALVVDQLSKWWALDELEDGSVIEVLPTLEFDLHYNTGFSFGTGTGMGRWIALLVVVLCLVLVHQIRVS